MAPRRTREHPIALFAFWLFVVNQKYKPGKHPLTVYLVPTTRDKLLPMLEEALGDITAVEV